MVTIGIDLDNTFWNLGETALGILNDRYGYSCDYNYLYSYNVEMAHPDFTREDIDKIYYEAAIVCKPYDNAVNIVYDLMCMENIRAFFVTSSTPQEVVIKSERLNQMLEGKCNYHDIIVMQHKELLNVDIMIDDLYRNLTNPYLSLGLLYSQPYNSEDIPINGKNIKRVSNWEMIKYEINNYLFNINKEG